MSSWSPEPWELMYDHGRRGGTAPKCDQCGRFAKRLHEIWVTSPEPCPEMAICDRCKARRDRKLKAARETL